MQVEIFIEVRNILNRIYLDGIGRYGYPPSVYSSLINSIEYLPEKSIHIKALSVSNAPFAWKRDNLYVLKASNHYMFSYMIFADVKTGEDVCAIYEIAKDGRILTESNMSYSQKEMLYESIMQDISRIVKRRIEQL